jgi:hypothetical protein
MFGYPDFAINCTNSPSLMQLARFNDVQLIARRVVISH